MKNTVLLFAFVLVSIFTLNAQKIYLCQSDKDADIIAFITDYKNKADIIVYKCYTKENAVGNNGRWFFVKDKKDADVKIFIDEYKTDAKLFIYYTNNKKYAAWRNYSKKHLLNKK